MPMTCISCHVAFTSTDLQREHYKGDWHRYNLMRKVAELPPITCEEFEQRAQLQKTSVEEERDNQHCQSCRKFFSTKNAYENHLKSKRHIDSLSTQPESSIPYSVLKKNLKNTAKSLEAKIEDLCLVDDDDSGEEGDDSDWESVEEVEFDITSCLFCGLESKDLETNLKHMSVTHSFFLPDLEYLTELSGLVAYLGGKVMDGFTCLWCNKEFHSVDSVQKHMSDKGHCKMKYEGESLLEYSDYYDYTSSYPEDGSEEVPEMNLEGDDWQLTLPSGTSVGHRSLHRYYKQNLRPERPGGPAKSRKAIHRLMHEYRSLGWRDTPERVAQRNAKDLRYMQRVVSKHQLRLSEKANRFQPHFRPQVVF